ncbi:MAG: LacI family DNA-binding transcriptional regulator [Planctomycetota bacterium]|jgi:LacI family transcriptional regulator|nr:LacI family DNA-binding transcriptional regulator [Planctomycetota bacterium]
MSHATVTLDEIAKRAGVSSRTAYRILNGEGGKGARKDAIERAERIRAVAHELGYRPNQAARAMRDGRFGAAGLMLSRGESTSTVQSGLLQGVHDGLAEVGMHLTVARMSDDQFRDERYLPGALRDQMLDGLIMAYSHNEPPELVALLERYRIPTVWVNNARAGDCVCPADREAARLATEHLLKMGHKRIAYWSFSMPGGHYSIADRRAGYCDAMQAAGRRPVIRERELVTTTAAREGDDFLAVAREWLDVKQRPTAIVGESQGVGLVASMAVLALGLRYPEDVSIMFVDQNVEDVGGLALSRFYCQAAAMGRAAVHELTAKIADPSTIRTPVSVPFTLFTGRTCAPPT